MSRGLAWKQLPLVLLSFLVWTSCAQRPLRVTAPPEPPSTGEVSYRILSDADSNKQATPEGWEFHRPQLIGQVYLPDYPENALKARFGSAVSIVRIAIDARGEVTDVKRREGSTPGCFSEDFFRAAETAVRKWRFTRPEWWHLEDGADINGDGKPDFQKVIERKEGTGYGDIEFRFEITGNKGEVSVGR